MPLIDLYPIVIAILAILVLVSMFRILREYQRGVIFRLGRFYRVKGPGLIIVVPFVQQVVRVDLRTVTLDVPSQEIISRDNVAIKVNSVLYFRVVDPQKAIINVENYVEATIQLAQTTLRSVLGQHDLDEILSARETINQNLQRTLDEHTEPWGIKISHVEIKHVDLDESMIQAIARQAEAERIRRAKVSHANGELEASRKLLDAAKILAQEPQAIQLRYLQTLTDVSRENSSTIVLALPMELLKAVGSNTPK
jgi:regulator of protease activity HflC (stomatin/prohibitin superfamily)